MLIAPKVFNDIVAQLPDAIFVIDRSGAICFANAAAGALLGYSGEELLQAKVDLLVPPSQRGEHQGMVRGFFSEPRPRPMGLVEISAWHKSGYEIPVDIQLKPVSQDGEPYVVASMRDISHIRRDEARLKDFAVELQKINGKLLGLNEEKNKFLGLAAHDLRTPLSAIIGYAKIIGNDIFGLDEKSKKEMLLKIEESSQLMLSLVDDLLDISAIESGTVTLMLSETDLGELTRKTCETYRALAKQKHIELRYVPESKLPRAKVDQPKLGQVLGNLLTNAIKYSPENTAVTIACTATPEGVEFSVKDQGQGISEEDQSRLFKPFSKAASRPTGGEKSTGLGLAIVKRIVDAHGGRIWVTSALKSGSTFYFSVPLNPPPTQITRA